MELLFVNLRSPSLMLSAHAAQASFLEIQPYHAHGTLLPPSLPSPFTTAAAFQKDFPSNKADWHCPRRPYCPCGALDYSLSSTLHVNKQERVLVVRAISTGKGKLPRSSSDPNLSPGLWSYQSWMSSNCFLHHPFHLEDTDCENFLLHWSTLKLCYSRPVFSRDTSF